MSNVEFFFGGCLVQVEKQSQNSLLLLHFVVQCVCVLHMLQVQKNLPFTLILL